MRKDVMRQVQKRACAGRGVVIYWQKHSDEEQIQEFISSLSSDWKELLQQALDDNQPVDAKVFGDLHGLLDPSPTPELKLPNTNKRDRKLLKGASPVAAVLEGLLATSRPAAAARCPA